MKPQSSGAFLIKRPFDLQEAVVLLDVYLSMVKNGVPITMAAEKASVKIYTEGLNLEPIDVDALWKENERLMLGLEKTSIIPSLS